MRSTGDVRAVAVPAVISAVVAVVAFKTPMPRAELAPEEAVVALGPASTAARAFWEQVVMAAMA